MADARTPDTAEPASRVARLRVRADTAAERYLSLARRRPALGLPIVLGARYISRQGILLASATAFRLFLWFLPLALLLAGVLAALSAGDSGDVRSAAKSAGITGAASQEIVTAIREGRQSWHTAVLFGAVLLLWATRTLIRNLVLINAAAWGIPRPKRRQKDTLITTLYFVGAWIVIFAVTAAITRLDLRLPGADTLGVFIEGTVVAGAWLAISLRLPDSRHSWIDLVPGSLMVGYGIAVLHLASLVYLPYRLGRSSELYGSLGVAAVILAWLLVIGQVIVVGALTNSVWAEYRATHKAPVSP